MNTRIRGFPNEYRLKPKTKTVHVHGDKHMSKSQCIGILRSKIYDIYYQIEHLKEEISLRKHNQPIIENLSQKIIKLEDENTKCESDIAIYNSAIDYIQNGTSIEDIISKCDELEKLNHKYEEEIIKLSKENKDLENNVIELEEESPEFQSMLHEIELFNSKFYDFNRKFHEKQLKKTIEETNKKIDNTEKMIQNEKKVILNVTEQINAIENQRKKILKKTQQDLIEFQNRVYDSLINTSNDIKNISNLPTTQKFQKIKKEIECKEKEIQETQPALNTLRSQVDKYRYELDHINEIDIKIKKEIEVTKQKMKNEIQKIYDIEILRKNEEIKIKNKMDEIDHLKSQLINIKKATDSMVDKYIKSYNLISTNEINAKLNSLEEEIGEIASKNYAISEYIEEIKRKDRIKSNSMNIVNEPK